MKDIKLTIEDIKKIFECFEVEGYKPFPNIAFIKFKNGDYQKDYELSSDEWKFDKLGDFLQRVIEAINRQCKKYGAKISIQGVAVYRFGTSLEKEYNYFANNGEDQAKTQAIKYILDKL